MDTPTANPTPSPAQTVLTQVVAAAVPTLVSAIPALATELVSFIASLAHKHSTAAQATKTPGTGPAVFGDVLNAVLKDLVKTHAAGQLRGAIPDQATVIIIIQAVYTAIGLSVDASVVPAIPGVSAAARSIVLKSGDTFAISVA